MKQKDIEIFRVTNSKDRCLNRNFIRLCTLSENLGEDIGNI